MNKYFAILVFIGIMILNSSCNKDEPDEPSNPNPTDELVVNEIIDLNEVEGTFAFEVVNEKLVNGVLNGVYSLKDASDDFEAKITKGSLVYLPDSIGKLIYVTDVSITRSIDLDFEGINLGLNFVYQNGTFEYAGYPNRTKLNVSSTGTVPQGLYFSQNPPILRKEEMKSENSNVNIYSDGDNNLIASIDEIKLLDKPNAKLSIKNASIKLNPTYDVYADFEPMSEQEKNEYLQNLENNNVIKNVADFAGFAIGNCNKIGVISYTDFDASWSTEVIAGTSVSNEYSTKVKIFTTNKVFTAGVVPISIKTTGYLRAYLDASASIDDIINTNIENDIIVGAEYDVTSGSIEGINEFNFNPQIGNNPDAVVNAHFKVEYVQDVEIYVLGVIGPNIEFVPHVGGEVYFEATGDQNKSLGLFSSYDFSYACDISAFHLERFTYPLPTSILEYESGIHIDKHYFYKLPNKIEIIEGNNQTGSQGVQLTEPVSVRVTDNLGEPLANIPVRFSPIDGGAVSETSVLTDVNGEASVFWTPGNPNNEKKSSLNAIIRYYEFSNGAFQPTLADTKSFSATIEEEKIYLGDVSLISQSEVEEFGMEKYSKIAGTLSIEGDDIIDLSPLVDLIEVQSNFHIVNTGLSDFTGLGALSTIGTNFYIADNTNILSFNGLANLAIGKTLTISNNNLLTNLIGLGGITGLPYGQLNISDNDNLLNLEGAQNINDALSLNISNNLVLEDFCAISNLISLSDLPEGYFVNGNEYNPTIQDLMDGNCTEMGNNPDQGTFIDERDNQEYDWVKIGDQIWMAENLNFGAMINGMSEMTNNSIFEKYCLDNNTSNCDLYGGFYLWDEVMQYSTIESTQGVCPDGWHLPSDQEWQNLEIELGMSLEEANKTGYRGTNEASKMAGNSSEWVNGNLVNNSEFGSSGLFILPAGSRHYLGFVDSPTGTHAKFWTSSSSGSDHWMRFFHNAHSSLKREIEVENYGFSVRCVKD